MRARHRKAGTYYYLDTGAKPRKEIPLGSDYVLAVQKWAELTMSNAPRNGLVTFKYAAERYIKDVLPTKAPRTRKDNLKELECLYQFFNNPPALLDDIEPIHIGQYKAWRTDKAKADAARRNEERVKREKEPLPIDPKLGQVRANRELALFSHIFNYARENGLTSNTNPSDGVKKFKEDGRDVYVDQAMFDRLLKHSCQALQYALRLAYLTGQRPADVYKMSETDIKDGILWIKQGKTKAPLRILIEGELKTLLDEIADYKRQFSVRPLALLVTETGQAMNEYTMRTRFDKARDAAGIPKAELQFRDMRPKAGTDVDEIKGTKAAQDLLGHTTEGMTTRYIRHKIGKLVKPTK
jgi:integrase